MALRQASAEGVRLSVRVFNFAKITIAGDHRHALHKVVAACIENVLQLNMKLVHMSYIKEHDPTLIIRQHKLGRIQKSKHSSGSYIYGYIEAL